MLATKPAAQGPESNLWCWWEHFHTSPLKRAINFRPMGALQDDQEHDCDVVSHRGEAVQQEVGICGSRQPLVLQEFPVVLDLVSGGSGSRHLSI